MVPWGWNLDVTYVSCIVILGSMHPYSYCGHAFDHLGVDSKQSLRGWKLVDAAPLSNFGPTNGYNSFLGPTLLFGGKYLLCGALGHPKTRDNSAKCRHKSLR